MRDRRLRVVHYLNQFFAGLGGEDAADRAPEWRAGPFGPGRALQSEFGDAAEVVGTIVCGDNYSQEHAEALRGFVVRLVAEARADVFVAGPAFGSGRYGLACGDTCGAVVAGLGIPAVMAMAPDNPAVPLHRGPAVIVRSGPTASSMGATLPSLARIAIKLGRREPLGSPNEEGYLSRGRRENRFAEKRGAARAVEMLLAKLAGQQYQTELPLPSFDRVPPAPPIGPLGSAAIALATEGGIVPKGNPDRLPAGRATAWRRYLISDLAGLTPETHECVDNGFDNRYANRDPNRILPVDAARRLVLRGWIGALDAYYYVTVGSGTPVPSSVRFGQEIGAELRARGVDAMILTAT